MIEKLTDGWLIDDDTFRWIGTKEEFEEWLKLWRVLIPKCNDFICCHDSDSCCINFACGEGSIVETMRRGTGSICESVNCIDCLKRYTCKFGRMSQLQAEGLKLRFIHYEMQEGDTKGELV
jgi:hypothetical protein